MPSVRTRLPAPNSTSMLTKNVYLIYPAGYSGSYVSWAISISDLDTRKDTVPDPVNKTESEQFGGAGTSHLHTRIPTHQGYDSHVNWVLYNRPTEAKIYLLNPGMFNDTNNFIVSKLLQHDPTGIIINIYDNEEDIRSYGIINAVTKWPTYIAAMSAWSSTAMHSTFDIENCKDDRTLRNFIVNNNNFFSTNKLLDPAAIDKNLIPWVNWYAVRNAYQPHEVNSATYNIKTFVEYDTENRIFEMSCLDIASNRFPTILQDIMSRSQVSDNYDTAYATQFHPTYVTAQNNLQWFDSIANWRVTGQLDQYLISHSVIEACVIREMFKNINIDLFTHQQNASWAEFYNSVKADSWPASSRAIDYFNLPVAIQTELVEVFGYAPKYVPPEFTRWEDCSLVIINDVYQSTYL